MRVDTSRQKLLTSFVQLIHSLTFKYALIPVAREVFFSTYTWALQYIMRRLTCGHTLGHTHTHTLQDCKSVAMSNNHLLTKQNVDADYLQ